MSGGLSYVFGWLTKPKRVDDHTIENPMEDTKKPASASPTLADVFRPRPSDVFIAVMGVTGVGKSTLISLCTKRNVKVGHGLGSCTQEVAVYTYEYSSETTVYLVDTPGFDDETRSDTAVLTELATWLTESYANKIILNGIIYIHRITDNKLGGSAKSNLTMFQKLCGPQAFSNVILATTMWECVEPQVGEDREAELISRSDYWGFMISRGSKVVRHMNTKESALRLIEEYASKSSTIKPKPLELQVDMVENKLGLGQTRAGREVGGQIEEEKARLQRDLEDFKKSIQNSLKEKDVALADALKIQADEANQKMNKLRKQEEDLRKSMEELHKEQFAKLETSLKRARDETNSMQERLRSKEREIEKEKQEAAREKLLADTKNRNDLRELELRLQSKEESVKTAEAESARLQRELEERINTLSLAADLDPPFRSKAGKNRINEYASVALCGNNYYFSGPAIDYWRAPSSFDQTEGSMRHVSFGEKESWYRHYHNDDSCWTERSGNFDNYYPALAKAIETDKLYGCPDSLSLGVNGSYFAKFASTRYWSLPTNIIETIGESEMASVVHMWLGKGNTYIASFENGRVAWDLKGKYGSLASSISDRDDSLKTVALNLEDFSSYAAVWDNAHCEYCTGNDTFKSFYFEEYATTNFGCTWS